MIQVIEEPSRESLMDEDLASIVGGWSCESYSKILFFKPRCKEWDKHSACMVDKQATNYCGEYVVNFRKIK